MSGRALLYCGGGGVGDSLVATVVARALRGSYARVDALTLPSHRAALERVPDLDDVLVDEGTPGEMAQRLCGAAYDAAVVTWATVRTALVPALAGIPIRVGQARRLYSRRFTHRVAVRSELGDVTTHWSQILLDYARAIGCDTDDAVPRFEPTADDRDEAGALIARHGLDRFALLHTNNAVATERGTWPLGGWIALSRALAERFGVRVVIGGAPADRPIAQAVAAASGALAIAGEGGLGTYGALARRAQFFCGITTGSMHVAAASGAPTVGIFPFQTDVPERWAPLGRSTAVVRATYPCRPGERKETCPDYACVAALDVARILSAVESLLE